MGLLSIELKCNECEEIYGALVDREERNTPQVCEKCHIGLASRVWSVPNVSTTKLSDSIPDVVAKGRFDHQRRQQEARKELAKAKKALSKNPSDKTREEVRRAREEKAKIDKKR